MTNDLTVIKKTSQSTITLKCDPAIIDDLVFMLEKLLLMSKYLKNRMIYVNAEAKAKDPEKQAAQYTEFCDKSREVYLRYMSLLKSDCSRSEALKRLRREFEVGYYDCEIYITQGRKLEKEKKHERIREDHNKGYSISELAGLHGLSYATIKKIVEDKR